MPCESRVRSSNASIEQLEAGIDGPSDPPRFPGRGDGVRCSERGPAPRPRIINRKGPSGVLKVEFCGVQGRMIDVNSALQAKFFCAARKPRDPNMIAESVLNETQA